MLRVVDQQRDRDRAREALYLGAGLAGIAGRAGVGATRRVLRVTAAVVDRAPAPVGDAVDALARRGRRDAEVAAATALQLAERVAHQFARHPIFIQVVNEVVDAVLPGAIDTALPSVLGRLEEQPEEIRGIVFAQSTGMTTELLTRVRARAAAGDSAVERGVDRWRRPRNGQEAPAPEP
jgi:hypothetical protein